MATSINNNSQLESDIVHQNASRPTNMRLMQPSEAVARGRDVDLFCERERDPAQGITA